MTTTPSGTPFKSGNITAYLDAIERIEVYDGTLKIGDAIRSDGAMIPPTRDDRSTLWDTYAIEQAQTVQQVNDGAATWEITDALLDLDEQINAHLDLEDRVTDHEQDHSDAGGRLCKDENDDGTCAVCGVGLDKCETCDGLGYHFGGCPDSDATDDAGSVIEPHHALDQIAALYQEDMSGADFIQDVCSILLASGFEYQGCEVVRFVESADPEWDVSLWNATTLAEKVERVRADSSTLAGVLAKKQSGDADPETGWKVVKVVRVEGGAS